MVVVVAVVVAVVVVVVVVDMAMVMVATVVSIPPIYSILFPLLFIASLFKVVGVTVVLATEVIINSYNNHLNYIIPNYQI